MVPVTASIGVTDGLSGSNGFTLQSISVTPWMKLQGKVEGFIVGTPCVTGFVQAVKGNKYTLSYEASDKAGNTASCPLTVTVTRDESQ